MPEVTSDIIAEDNAKPVKRQGKFARTRRNLPHPQPNSERGVGDFAAELTGFQPQQGFVALARCFRTLTIWIGYALVILRADLRSAPTGSAHCRGGSQI